MPVSSLSSSVLTWPDARTIDQAVHCWVEKIVSHRQDVLRIGYFGSYARGDWGVGSDLDLVIVLESSEKPFERRGLEWDVSELPVPVDILVYTQAEWDSLSQQRRFYQTLMREAVWVYVKGDRPLSSQP